ncbi:MAG: DUF86 domain-containing protein [Candidatus Lokiarchaeota archaeon]|nr:DUF86 domain-containing protein [Candidatus Lokiarchaeota archaeon]
MKRYRDKINYITENLHFFDAAPKNELEKRGLFYTIQTSIEGIIDMIAMCLRDVGLEVAEDAYNIDKVAETFKVSKELGERLKLANGMRNILVHRYNGVEETIVLDSIQDLKTVLVAWIEVIEQFLSKVAGHG